MPCRSSRAVPSIHIYIYILCLCALPFLLAFFLPLLGFSLSLYSWSCSFFFFFYPIRHLLPNALGSFSNRITHSCSSTYLLPVSRSISSSFFLVFTNYTSSSTTLEYTTWNIFENTLACRHYYCLFFGLFFWRVRLSRQVGNWTVQSTVEKSQNSSPFSRLQGDDVEKKMTTERKDDFWMRNNFVQLRGFPKIARLKIQTKVSVVLDQLTIRQRINLALVRCFVCTQSQIRIPIAEFRTTLKTIDRDAGFSISNRDQLNKRLKKKRNNLYTFWIPDFVLSARFIFQLLECK